MSKTGVNIIITFVVILLLQVTIFSRICLFDYAVPFIFIYALMRLPMSLAPSLVMIIGFFSGMFVDIFADTPGMNALASTVLCALRRPVMKLFSNRDDDIDAAMPSAKSNGAFTYSKYSLTLTIAYCLVIFFVEASSFAQIHTTLLRVFFSTLLSFALIMGIDSITSNRNNDKKTNTL